MKTSKLRTVSTLVAILIILFTLSAIQAVSVNSHTNCTDAMYYHYEEMNEENTMTLEELNQQFIENGWFKEKFDDSNTVSLEEALELSKAFDLIIAPSGATCCDGPPSLRWAYDTMRHVLDSNGRCVMHAYYYNYKCTKCGTIWDSRCDFLDGRQY